MKIPPREKHMQRIHRYLVSLLLGATMVAPMVITASPNPQDRKEEKREEKRELERRYCDRDVYNSIPKPLPGNVFSEGPEAYAFAELGDAVALTVNTGTVARVTVILSSLACQRGNWTSGCVTHPGATFSQPLTVNLYSVNSGTSPISVASPLGTITETFDIPYRPTSNCQSDTTAWYSNKDKTCYHGLAVPVVVNFSRQHIAIPTDGKLIVTVAFNSTHYGPSPIGESAACFGTSAGCPYDSLNISTDTQAGVFVGGPLDPNGIFVNYTLPNNSCTGTIATGTLVDDTAPACWTGNHPQIEIVAKDTTAPHNPKRRDGRGVFTCEPKPEDD
jgi:hypothetical protein